MNTKNFWKIMGGGQLILTDCPDRFKDGGGVYYLMKCLQQIYGYDSFAEYYHNSIVD